MQDVEFVNSHGQIEKGTLWHIYAGVDVKDGLLVWTG